MGEFKGGAASEAFWIRTFFVVAFWFVYRLLDIAVLMLAVAQWVMQLINGSADVRLRRYGASLGLYSAQIIRFLTGVTDEKPFPFADWPESD